MVATWASAGVGFVLSAYRIGTKSAQNCTEHGRQRSAYLQIAD